MSYRNLQRISYLFFFWLTTTIVATSSCLAAPLSASLDRTVMAADETVTLTIETTQTDNSSQPDLEPLRAQFDILGVSQSSRIQIINGKTDSTKSWIINLAPKEQGLLTLPPLRVGPDQTEKLTLKVEAAGQSTDPAAGSGDRDDVYLEMSADITDPYVQQQVIVTQRLFYRVPLREGALSKLESDGALVEKLGEDKEFEKDVNGQRYHVIERRYAVFPQKSGQLVLPAAQLSAQIPDQRGKNSSFNRLFGRDIDDPFGMLQSLRPISRRSETITLEVRPQPAEVLDGPWLPARQVTLEEEWTPDNTHLIAGQPVTRTVRVIAEGLASNQFPPLPVPELAFAKVYPDQTSSKHVAQANGLTATIEQKLAIIPQDGGDYILPEVRIPWWNVVTQRQEIALLPPRKVHVQKDPSTSLPTPPPSTPINNVDIPKFEPIVAQPIEPTTPAHHFWQALTATLALGWVVTLVLWRNDRRRHTRIRSRTQSGPSTSKSTTTTRTAINQLKDACQNNDPRAATQALLVWGNATWPDTAPRTLPALAARLTDANAQHAILNLDRMLYCETPSDWNGRDLLNVVAAGLKVPSPSDAKEDDLPPLYPSATQS